MTETEMLQDLVCSISVYYRNTEICVADQHMQNDKMCLSHIIYQLRSLRENMQLPLKDGAQDLPKKKAEAPTTTLQCTVAILKRLTQRHCYNMYKSWVFVNQFDIIFCKKHFS